MPHLIYIIFLFALGSCVGSFLNVVVWRTPRIEHPENEGLLRGFFTTLHGLSDPPSHCPNCNKRLKWYDNLPVLGWIKLGGKCRFCQQPFSIRYPIVEAITGLLFVGYYVAYFMFQTGPCVRVMPSGEIVRAHMNIVQDWWLYGLDMALISAMLAGSLIDAELFQIPIEIPWSIVPIALIVHAVFDAPMTPGNLIFSPVLSALALGAGVGTIISIILVNTGILPTSFAEGDPLLEVEKAELEAKRRQAEQASQSKGKKKKSSANAKTPSIDEEAELEFTPGEIRREIGKEMLFLLVPMALAALCVILVLRFASIGQWWDDVLAHRWVGGLLGSVLGGLVGGFVVWLTRILGSLGFGRQAMGMGDVDLMVAVGAVLGPGPAVAAFFLAPFFGIGVAIFMLFARRTREMPYGPYLSLASAFVMLFYPPIAAYFAPGISNLASILARTMGGG